MKESILILVCLGLSLMAVPVQGQSKRSELAAVNRQRAEISMADGKFDRAIAYLDTALENTPRDPMLYLMRGKACLANKEPRAAILDFSKALKLDPKLGEAYYQRGLAYQIKGKTAKAEHDFDTARQLNYVPVKDQ